MNVKPDALLPCLNLSVTALLLERSVESNIWGPSFAGFNIVLVALGAVRFSVSPADLIVL